MVVWRQPWCWRGSWELVLHGQQQEERATWSLAWASKTSKCTPSDTLPLTPSRRPSVLRVPLPTGLRGLFSFKPLHLAYTKSWLGSPVLHKPSLVIEVKGLLRRKEDDQKVKVIPLSYIESSRLAWGPWTLSQKQNVWALKLRVLAVLPVDLGSLPRTHMEGHNCLSFQFRGLESLGTYAFFLASAGTHTYV